MGRTDVVLQVSCGWCGEPAIHACVDGSLPLIKGREAARDTAASTHTQLGIPLYPLVLSVQGFVEGVDCTYVHSTKCLWPLKKDTVCTYVAAHIAVVGS